MNLIIYAGGGVVLALLVGILATRRTRRKIKPDQFKKKWDDLQKLCAERETWPLAVVTADKLLDEALKKHRYKGKSMGERLVDAQRELSDNDAVWFAHNLSKKILSRSVKRLRETDVKRSLVGMRQAMRDLGVLHGK